MGVACGGRIRTEFVALFPRAKAQDYQSEAPLRLIPNLRHNWVRGSGHLGVPIPAPNFIVIPSKAKNLLAAASNLANTNAPFQHQISQSS